MTNGNGIVFQKQGGIPASSFNLFYLHQITCLNSCTFFNCSYQWTHNVIISYIIYNISYSFLYVPFSDKNKQVRILPKSYFQMQGIDNCLNTAQKQSLPLLITKNNNKNNNNNNNNTFQNG